MSTKKYRDAHKEETKAYNKKYREEHPDYHSNYRETNKDKIKKYATTNRHRFNVSKAIAKKRDKEWNIPFAEYCGIISQPCFYCGGAFGIVVTQSSGLDRLDNSKGYIVGNVVSCCTACNRLKGDYFSAEEAKVAVLAIIQFRETSKEKPNAVLYDVHN